MYNPLNRQIFLKEQVVKALEQALDCYDLIGEDYPYELLKDLREAKNDLKGLKVEERKVKLKENLKRKNRKVNKAVNEELEKVREALKKSNRDFEAFENYEHGNKNL